jgi:hypothetical protein
VECLQIKETSMVSMARLKRIRGTSQQAELIPPVFLNHHRATPVQPSQK